MDPASYINAHLLIRKVIKRDGLKDQCLCPKTSLWPPTVTKSITCLYLLSSQLPKDHSWKLTAGNANCKIEKWLFVYHVNVASQKATQLFLENIQINIAMQTILLL